MCLSTNVSGAKNYNSRYGISTLQARNEYNPSINNEVKKDSFNPKYKKKKVNASVLGTLALTAGALFAGYKGKNHIQKAVSSCSKVVKNNISKFSNKCPNLAQAGHSIKEACKTPINACKKPLASIGKFFTSILKKK